jgi:hypothetical protein
MKIVQDTGGKHRRKVRDEEFKIQRLARMATKTIRGIGVKYKEDGWSGKFKKEGLERVDTDTFQESWQS